MQDPSTFIPTALVTGFLGYLGVRATRAGQKDQARISAAAQQVTEKQEERAELQAGLDTWKGIAEERKEQLADERAERRAERTLMQAQLAEWQSLVMNHIKQVASETAGHEIELPDNPHN